MASTLPMEPLALKSTPALIADRVRTSILGGQFPPDMQLSESVLAEQLAVSRGPVREAMQRLIQEGLLRSERNRGVFVVSLDQSDMRDIYLARSAVERTAAAIVAAHGTDEDFASLQGIVDKLAGSLDESWGDLVQVDLEFHSAVVALAGSPRLDRMFRTLIAETQLCLIRLERFYPGRAELVEEHQDILDALRSRDLDVTDRLVREHMDASIRRLSPPDSAAD